MKEKGCYLLNKKIESKLKRKVEECTKWRSRVV